MYLENRSQYNSLIIPPFVATSAEVVGGGGIGESGEEAAVVKEVTELAGSLVAVGVGENGFVDETGTQLEVFVMTIEGGVDGIGNLGDGIADGIVVEVAAVTRKEPALVDRVAETQGVLNLCIGTLIGVAVGLHRALIL